MANTYISTDKLNGLKAYLKKSLTNETIETIKQLESKGCELNYENTEKNKQILWQYIYNEVRGINPPVNNMYLPQVQNFKNLYDRGHFTEAGEIVSQYRDIHYKNEWKIITNDFKPTEIQNTINGFDGFCVKNHIDRMNLKELIFTGIDEYLKKYESQNVDKELIKTTERIAEYIDKTYFAQRSESGYNIYQQAIKTYMITGDRQLLHNMLNKQY